MVYKRSWDGGETWTDLTLFYTNSSGGEVNVIGNAAPVQDASTGRIWVPFCRNNEEVFISYSDDIGATWSAPVYHPELVNDDWKWGMFYENVCVDPCYTIFLWDLFFC